MRVIQFLLCIIVNVVASHQWPLESMTLFKISQIDSTRNALRLHSFSTVNNEQDLVVYRSQSAAIHSIIAPMSGEIIHITSSSILLRSSSSSTSSLLSYMLLDHFSPLSSLTLGDSVVIGQRLGFVESFVDWHLFESSDALPKDCLSLLCLSQRASAVSPTDLFENERFALVPPARCRAASYCGAGVCVDGGLCRCVPGWRGRTCSETAPALHHLARRQTENSTTTSSSPTDCECKTNEDENCGEDCKCTMFYSTDRGTSDEPCAIDRDLVFILAAVGVVVVCLIFVVSMVCVAVKRRRRKRSAKSRQGLELSQAGQSFRNTSLPAAAFNPPPATNTAPTPVPASAAALPTPIADNSGFDPMRGGAAEGGHMPLQGGVSFRNVPPPMIGADTNAFPSPGAVQPFQSARDFGVSQAPRTGSGGVAEDYYISIVELQLEGEIGRGAYGVVFQGRHRGVEVAIKQLDVKGGVSSPDYDAQLKEFQEEADFMIKLPPHPNVVMLIGVTPPPNFWIVTEFLARGSLYTLLHSAEAIADRTQFNIIKGIAAGMSHLHGQNIVHRDLAARNILLDAGMNAKISDFGLSRFGAEDQEMKTKSDVGPIKWMSPEAIKDKVYSQKSDVWSFGVTVWEVLTRQNPYPSMDLIQVATAVCYKNLRPDVPPGTPTILKNMMDMCFERKADRRPHMRDISAMLQQSGR